MNLELFHQLWDNSTPGAQQQIHEWQMFLEICETYLINHSIKKPIVVELGIGRNEQRKYYEQLLGTEHIGVDKYDRRGIPDILGDSRDPRTVRALKKKLNGRPVDILFIDANHCYEVVKKDYEIYSPLCNGIVALHDVETARYRRHSKREVWKFWDELKEKSLTTEGEISNFLFLLMHRHLAENIKYYMGIGMIIKR